MVNCIIIKCYRCQERRSTLDSVRTRGEGGFGEERGSQSGFSGGRLLQEGGVPSGVSQLQSQPGSVPRSLSSVVNRDIGAVVTPALRGSGPCLVSLPILYSSVSSPHATVRLAALLYRSVGVFQPVRNKPHGPFGCTLWRSCKRHTIDYGPTWPPHM